MPGIDFSKLWKDNITDKTRETIWKYLQLLLYSTVSGITDNSMFKDTAKLFEAIDENALKNKLEETIKHMEDLFNNNEKEDEDGNEENQSGSDFSSADLPDAEKLHEHVTSMMDGKLGNLAKEIAEETAKDLNLDLDDDKSGSMEGVFENLFKNPTKIMNLVKR